MRGLEMERKGELWASWKEEARKERRKAISAVKGLVVKGME